MYAYRLPAFEASNEQISDGRIVHPSGHRLNIAGPWQLCKHPLGGTLATFRSPDGRIPPLSSFGEPIECDDGLLFYPPKEPLRPEQVAKPRIGESITVTMHSGVMLSIPLAARSPRKRAFTRKNPIGDYIDEYPRLVYSVYDRIAAKEVVLTSDPELVRMLYLAVAAGYRVTEEALSHAGWLSTADDDPIMMAAFGSDPKAGAAAGGTSP